MLNLLDPLLAPFARLLVAHGVSFPDLMERLKGHYLAAASRQARREGSKLTDSRLSVMTGLQRRDIVRLRDMPTPKSRPNHLATLIARWQTDPHYASAPLPKTGPAPSFDALAKEIRRDIHPRTMLDALLAAGTVRLDGDQIILQQSSYQPAKGSEDQIAYLAHNLGDHFQTAAENVQGQSPPHFERAVHYTGLTKTQIEALRQEHANGQMALFEALSRQAAAMKQGNGPDAEHRFRAGSYFLATPTEQGDA